VVKNDSTAEQRKVTPGQRQEDLVVISEGLQPGERVIVNGQLGVTPGGKVRVEGDAAVSAAPVKKVEGKS
jgi:multidrug efflux pump subunit AcrA (membrane-fusion protein)